MTLASGIMSLQCVSEISFPYTGGALPGQLLNTYFSHGDAGDQRLSPVACTLIPAALTRPACNEHAQEIPL